MRVDGRLFFCWTGSLGQRSSFFSSFFSRIFLNDDRMGFGTQRLVSFLLLFSFLFSFLFFSRGISSGLWNMEHGYTMTADMGGVCGVCGVDGGGGFLCLVWVWSWCLLGGCLFCEVVVLCSSGEGMEIHRLDCTELADWLAHCGWLMADE